ncbi:hypothetical protein GLAREA_02274 [Glarea lozoyensis ATCC 20868]|uniref:Uncharacterized protein n=1 Tax=Glarea lozoyensis (strain ATCC 20868 / MF5171) TaxID=1116229 RepID=S3CIP9_GLAL2|nr:uncharacterized protein GLAREA_02274 [Glarea lozoyensis ATCC 20868]EPE26362.1 hypothetical protein GLAREA_02274 [Glarea lozoyensis ATCC 20868]
MAQETVSWQNNEGRGTWDIISSCVLTLILCVWTALHLNVPKQNASLWHRFRTKALWVVVGIFAPEVVVYIAWVQYSSAKYLLKEIQALEADGTNLATQKSRPQVGHEDIEATAPHVYVPRKHKWTMSHCFFAGMGGFAFDSDLDNGGQEFIQGSPSLRFTSHAILALARLDKLPNVSTEEISDKSKADGLAKCLVCLQASWMLLQTLGRLIAGLPITLLEINTVGHCLCVLAIYLIWWNKPLHVLEPITLTGEFMRGFTSYAFMRSEMHEETMGNVSDVWRDKKAKYRNEVVFRTETERLQYVEWEYDLEGEHPVPSDPTAWMNWQHQDTWKGEIRKNYKILPNSYAKHFPPGGLVLALGEMIPGIDFTLKGFVVDTFKDRHENRKKENGVEPWLSPHRRFVINLSRTDLARWKLASDFLGANGGGEIFEDTRYNIRNYITTEVPDFAWTYSEYYVLHSSGDHDIVIRLATASAAYGGLHLSSWKAYFPTVVERWLWMSSCFFIAAFGCVPITLDLADNLLSAFKKSFPGFSKEFGKVTKKVNDWGGDYLIMIGIVIPCIAYCFARGFIVVDSFVALRKLPLAYYDTPVWSNYIPHL